MADSAGDEPPMLDSPSDDYPEVGTVLDLLPASRGDALMSWLDDVDGEDLVVAVPLDLARRPVALAVGEMIDVVWKTSGALRCLPVVLAGIDPGEPPQWRLRSAGVVRRGRRREAVRAPLRVPVTVGTGPSAARATSLDLSEGGLRCILDREARPAPREAAELSAQFAFRTGDVVRVSATFPDLTVACLSEITRLHPRDDSRTEMSVRFIGLSEHVQDDLRRRVFARLRDLRQRGLL
jgi:c-di-GMP-binding flagellar brake protein YcgR